MLVSEKNLRWCGIDMRPRWRRRMAVVLTYAAFVTAIWSPSIRVWAIVWSLFMASILIPIWPTLQDVEVWVRRVVQVAVLALLAFFVWRAWHAWFVPRRESTVPAAAFAFLLLLNESAIGWRKLVDNGDRGWMAAAIRKGSAASDWDQRRLARHGYAMGLEGFARYEYMLRFRQLTAAQKLEIEELVRSNPQGKWMRQRFSVLYDDERLRTEEDRLRARVQRMMTWLLVSVAVVASIALADSVTVPAGEVVASLWTLAGLVTTLRQTLVLWSEEDPRRNALGELTVVGEANAV